MTSTYRFENGDLVENTASGQPKLVEDTAKLRQDVSQILTTRRSDGVGAGLDDLVGLTSDPFVIQAEMTRRLNTSFDTLKKIHNSVQLADRSKAERLYGIDALRVSKGQTHTRFQFKLSVLSVDGATKGRAGDQVVLAGMLV